MIYLASSSDLDSKAILMFGKYFILYTALRTFLHSQSVVSLFSMCLWLLWLPESSCHTSINVTPGCILSLSVPVLQAVARGYIKDGSSWNLMPVIIKTVITYHANTNNIK